MTNEQDKLGEAIDRNERAIDFVDSDGCVEYEEQAEYELIRNAAKAYHQIKPLLESMQFIKDRVVDNIDLSNDDDDDVLDLCCELEKISEIMRGATNE